MPKLREIVEYLDNLLKISEIKDPSYNGLQVEGKEEVKKVILGVDASLELLEKAAKENADLVIVHHGILWENIKRIDMVNKKRLQILFANDISLYAAHLPLDKQEEIGNNMKLLRLFGIKKKGKFGEVGFWGKLEVPENLNKFARMIERKLNTKTVILNFGPKRIRNIAVVSGGGGYDIRNISATDIDTFITGEPTHYTYLYAKEAKINVIYIGHYRSEVVGVQEIGKKLKREFPSLNVKFIECPTNF